MTKNEQLYAQLAQVGIVRDLKIDYRRGVHGGYVFYATCLGETGTCYGKDGDSLDDALGALLRSLTLNSDELSSKFHELEKKLTTMLNVKCELADEEPHHDRRLGTNEKLPPKGDES